MWRKIFILLIPQGLTLPCPFQSCPHRSDGRPVRILCTGLLCCWNSNASRVKHHVPYELYHLCHKHPRHSHGLPANEWRGVDSGKRNRFVTALYWLYGQAMLLLLSSSFRKNLFRCFSKISNLKIQYYTQHNTTQHNTIYYNIIRYNTTQHNTIQHNTIQHNTTQHNTIQYKLHLRAAQYRETIQAKVMQYNTIKYKAMQYNN